MRKVTDQQVAAASRYLAQARREWDAAPVEPEHDKLPERLKPGTRFEPPVKPGWGRCKLFAAR